MGFVGGLSKKPPGSYCIQKRVYRKTSQNGCFDEGLLDDHILKFWGVPIILAKLRDIMQQREISMAG